MDIHSIYTAYDARADLDALLPDIEEALARAEDSALVAGGRAWIVDAALIDRLAETKIPSFDLTSLVHLCREINSCFAHGNIIATTLLMRAVLNYVPSLFGYETFSQVAANAGRSLKDSFAHLENGLRKVADYHTHRRIEVADSYPSAAQVEPFKPQFEMLLRQVLQRRENG